MGVDNQLSNKADEVGGKVKESAGKVTGDEELETEGKAEQVRAHVSQAGEKIKGMFKS